MALQTSGAISLLNIATEFGGTAPHSLSEYYRGGGLVPNTPANTNVPTSGVISLSNFYGASASSGSIVNPLPGQGTYTTSDETISYMQVRFTTNGLVYIEDTGTVYGAMLAGNWFTPATTNIGNSYWIRVILNSTSGSSDSGSNVTGWPLKPATSGTGSWLQISTDRTFGVNCTSTSLTRNRTANFTIQIASDSGGTNIVTSGTYTMSASSSVGPPV